MPLSFPLLPSRSSASSRSPGSVSLQAQLDLATARSRSGSLMHPPSARSSFSTPSPSGSSSVPWPGVAAYVSRPPVKRLSSLFSSASDHASLLEERRNSTDTNLTSDAVEDDSGGHKPSSDDMNTKDETSASLQAEAPSARSSPTARRHTVARKATLSRKRARADAKRRKHRAAAAAALAGKKGLPVMATRGSSLAYFEEKMGLASPRSSLSIGAKEGPGKEGEEDWEEEEEEEVWVDAPEWLTDDEPTPKAVDPAQAGEAALDVDAPHFDRSPSPMFFTSPSTPMPDDDSLSIPSSADADDEASLNRSRTTSTSSSPLLKKHDLASTCEFTSEEISPEDSASQTLFSRVQRPVVEEPVDRGEKMEKSGQSATAWWNAAGTGGQTAGTMRMWGVTPIPAGTNAEAPEPHSFGWPSPSFVGRGEKALEGSEVKSSVEAGEAGDDGLKRRGATKRGWAERFIYGEDDIALPPPPGFPNPGPTDSSVDASQGSHRPPRGGEDTFSVVSEGSRAPSSRQFASVEEGPGEPKRRLSRPPAWALEMPRPLAPISQAPSPPQRLPSAFFDAEEVSSSPPRSAKPQRPKSLPLFATSAVPGLARMGLGSRSPSSATTGRAKSSTRWAGKVERTRREPRQDQDEEVGRFG